MAAITNMCTAMTSLYIPGSKAAPEKTSEIQNVSISGMTKSEVERKLDELRTLLASNGKGPGFDERLDLATEHTAELPHSLPQPPTSIARPSSSTSHQTQRHLADHSPDSLGSTLFEGPHFLERYNVTSVDVGKALSKYMSTYINFPFLPIPLNTSYHTFYANRPCMSLSIVLMSSTSSPDLQQSLTHEFRAYLAQQVIMDGTKSLDLLQSLLVYLAWYHLYFDPQNQQMYQLVQLAVAMAEDLELSRLDCPPDIDAEAPNVKPRKLLDFICFWSINHSRKDEDILGLLLSLLVVSCLPRS
ncbi:hypothetical protein MMC25_008075 [Agyrium rufum]|nr:hypothetical protein [Agyrium rufum]